MNAHEWLDHAAAYALGALEEQEREAFEAHLVSCAICRTEVREMGEVAGLMALATPQVAPPVSLRKRVLDDARSVRSISMGSTRPKATPAAVPVQPARVAPVSSRTAPTRARDGGRSPVAASIPWLLAAASIIIAVMMGLRSRDAMQARQLASAAADTLRGIVADRDSLIATLLAPDVETVPMSSSGQPPSARIYWNKRSNMMVLAAFSLRPARSGRTYQAWAIEKNKAPVSLGTFNTDASGRTNARFAIPAGVRMNLSAITEEPEGGSPQPTTTPFLVASFKTG